MLAVEVLAPAKLNLVLAAGRRRADGYHPLATIFQTISLCDRLRVWPLPSQPSRAAGTEGIVLRVTGPEAAGVEAGPANLVARAYRAFRRRLGPAGPAGVRVALFKRVPKGAGLGGGSSDAAALLRALAQMTGRNDAEALAEAALEVGSDVPYFLTGGTRAAFGRGERLTALTPLPPEVVVVAKPPRELETGRVFLAFDRLRDDALADPAADPRWRKAVAAAAAGDRDALWRSVFNDLEPAALGLAPEIEEGRERLRAAGAQAVGLSGSGSALWAVMPSPAAADRVRRALRRAGWWAWSGRFVERLPAVRVLGRAGAGEGDPA
ncbi:MAG: 4-(cytidine 5'-diphospho)-2-C-methyl-D-erythritol kinase [Clostridia bacterium]|nr:4-(cytidine 5'-diphospho)-2-C-methyl-D-erythritol kinase [Clostridia bacterium]